MVMITNILIGFWLSPFVVENIGVEANGFVNLANNFVTYASLIVTALNSMAARFITIEYVKKDYYKANLYYNSVFWGNLIIVLVLLPPVLFLVGCLDKFVNIPPDLVFDVKLLFAFIFFNFFLQTGMPNWDCGAFISNRLDRRFIPSMFLAVLRCILLFSLMSLLEPKVWYVGAVSSIICILTLAVGWFNTTKLTPHLHIYLKRKKILCSWSAIKELVGSGIWNSISSIGSMLLSGLDLLIANLFIGPTEMGILSLGKMLPSYIQNLYNSIFNAFAPEIIINYASGDMDKMVHDLKRTMKIETAFLLIPLAGLIVLSKDFFKLWVPSQNAGLLAAVAILSSLEFVFTSGSRVLNCVFSTVNKVRPNSIMIILSGVISTITVFILLKTTNLGILAIAGTSAIVLILKEQFYTIPFASKYLGVKPWQFYCQELQCFFTTIVLCAVGSVVRIILDVNSWIDFIFVAAIMGVLFVLINFFILLNKEERKLLMEKIKRKKKSA